MSEQHESIRKLESYEKSADGVVFSCTTDRGNSIDIELSVCTPHILRLQMCPDPRRQSIKGLLEIREEWPGTSFAVREMPGMVSVDTGAVRFEVHKDPWCYTIYDQAGGVVLSEHTRDVDAHGDFRALPLGFATNEGVCSRCNETFRLSSSQHENFYGFGEKFTSLNKLGQRIVGWNKNPFGAGTEEAYKNIPFFVSTKGYGVFLNTTYRVTYEMGSTSLMSYTITMDDPRLDMFIIYGPSLKDILARYMQITGWPALPPKESFGIWFTLFSGDEVDAAVEVGRQFRELDIPVDFFMAPHHGVQLDTSVEEAEQVAKRLGELGIKAGMYVAPMLNIGSELEKEARERGYVLKRGDGSPYEVSLGLKPAGERGKAEYSLEMIGRDDAWRERHNGLFYVPCLLPDFTNPEAVGWWKEKIAERMRAGCFGVSMSDFGEDVPTDACYYNERPGHEMHNLYQLLYQKATFEAVEESTGHLGLVNARSGTAGMQRFPICWSGDPNCEWEDMLTTLRAGLSMGLSGVPFWSCDTAGFQDEAGNLTPELWVRWSQMSMFLSHTRLHGPGPLRAPWSFGQRAVENFRKYAKLRYRLLPYIYSQGYKAITTGLPLIRAMVLEFQDDPTTFDLDDQYLFGDALLVAPVCTPANRRTVYLPKGAWFDYWSGELQKGPATLEIEPPLEVLPLYVRGDSIIPMGPDMSYVGEKRFDPITLDIWLISRAEALVYDDDEIVRCRAERSDDGLVAVHLDASYKTYVLKVNRTGPPTRVSVNNVPVPCLGSYEELEMSDRGWWFDSSFVLYAKFKALGSSSQVLIQA